jgi:hypothetical protein
MGADTVLFATPFQANQALLSRQVQKSYLTLRPQSGHHQLAHAEFVGRRHRQHRNRRNQTPSRYNIRCHQSFGGPAGDDQLPSGPAVPDSRGRLECGCRGGGRRRQRRPQQQQRGTTQSASNVIWGTGTASALTLGKGE